MNNSPIQRDEPECKKAEFEGKPIPLEDFYDEDDNIMIVKAESAVAVLDFDDAIIMVQMTDTMNTYLMNLLYAREHFRNLYDLWYTEKENRNKGIKTDHVRETGSKSTGGR